jgi:hypothetical protein
MHDHGDVGRLFRRHTDALHLGENGDRDGDAILTNTRAVSRLVPSLKVILSVMLLSLVLCEGM